MGQPLLTILGMPIDGPTATLLVFTTTQLLAFIIYALTQRREKRTLIVGLNAELELNLKSLEEFLKTEPKLPAQLIRLLEEDPKYRPHLVFANESKFYDANLTNLARIDRKLSRLLLEFYSLMEDLRAEFAGLFRESFSTVRDKTGVVNGIWEVARDCSSAGRRAKLFMDRFYGGQLRDDRPWLEATP